MVKLRGCSSSLENFRASSSCGSTRRTWFVYSIAIDTTEVLRELAENAAPTIRNNRGMLERLEELFRRRLHYCTIDSNGGHFVLRLSALAKQIIPIGG
jgi:ribosomal protein S6